METERDRFTFFFSYFQAIQRIKDPEQRVLLYDSICKYAFFNEIPNLDECPDAVAVSFDLIRPILDKGKLRAEAGKRGGSKPKAGAKQKESDPEAIKDMEQEKEKEMEYGSGAEREGAGREAAAAFAELNGGEDGQRAEQEAFAARRAAQLAKLDQYQR